MPLNNLLGSIGRRAFLLRAGLVCGGIAVQGCVQKVKGRKKEYAHITATLSGPDQHSGHLIRDHRTLPEPQIERKVKTLIIGGGISGLSAARWLKKSGHTDFELIELESHAGGNSYFGANKVSKYPLGAHYLPIVNNSDELLVEFLKHHKVITHITEAGQPYYNEYYLCFDPEERLFINGEWQEGLVPDFGVPAADKKEIKRFLDLVHELRNKKGSDGKYVFNLPVDASSADAAWRRLDKISFAAYLAQEGFKSPYLLWYLDYCTKDDYGALCADVSAWAGLHYFAARRGTAANAETNDVLTWPEGNGWLMQRLKNEVQQHVKTALMAYHVEPGDNGVTVMAYDSRGKITSKIIAEKVIMATPQFVNQRVLKNTNRSRLNYNRMSYGSWLVANITIDDFPATKGTNLCWDNVMYGAQSVGYVNATQQRLNRAEGSKVITWYLPLVGKDVRVARLAAYSRNYDQWLDVLMQEMEKHHPGITKHVNTVNMWLWGHGMIRPSVDYIWGEARHEAMQPIQNRIFFAHTDLGGVSVFEEAFHQGIRAAKELLSA